MDSGLNIVIFDRDGKKRGNSGLDSAEEVESLTYYETLDQLENELDPYKTDIILVDLYSHKRKTSYNLNVERTIKRVEGLLNDLNKLRHQIRDEEIPLCWNADGLENARDIQQFLNDNDLKIPVAVYSRFGIILSENKKIFNINRDGIYWAYKEKDLRCSMAGIKDELDSVNNIIKAFRKRQKKYDMLDTALTKTRRLKKFAIIQSIVIFLGIFVYLQSTGQTGKLLFNIAGSLLASLIVSASSYSAIKPLVRK